MVGPPISYVQHSGAHRFWRLGDTGIELQHGTDVSTYKLPAHFHDDYQFMLVDSGAREITFRGDRRVFGDDILAIVNPGETHSTSCHGERGSSFKTMHLPPTIWARECGEFGAGPSEPLFPFAVNHARLLAVFGRLHALVETRGVTLQSEEMLAEFIETLMTGCKLRRRGARPRGPRRRVFLVRDCIEDDYARPFTLDELAALAGMSKYHLVRSFSEVLGMPPHAFQLRVKVNRAKKMLSSGMPIKRVAGITGFTDPSHFGKHFTRLVGVTPRSYQLAKDVRRHGLE